MQDLLRAERAGNEAEAPVHVYAFRPVVVFMNRWHAFSFIDTQLTAPLNGTQRFKVTITAVPSLDATLKLDWEIRGDGIAEANRPVTVFIPEPNGSGVPQPIYGLFLARPKPTAQRPGPILGKPRRTQIQITISVEVLTAGQWGGATETGTFASVVDLTVFHRDDFGPASAIGTEA